MVSEGESMASVGRAFSVQAGVALEQKLGAHMLAHRHEVEKKLTGSG